MKIKINVTKDILKRSMMCGTDINDTPDYVAENCAIALAVRDIFPKAMVTKNLLIFDASLQEVDNCFSKPIIKSKKEFMERIVEEKLGIEHSCKTKSFINLFDKFVIYPEKRLDLPEYSFEIEVPNEIIDSIGIDEAKKILQNSETLELVEI